MTYRFRPPDHPATLTDLRRARRREELSRTELDRVRTAALAWRNGLAALIAGLLGFSLIKGRSDIGDLDRAWAIAVGILLLAALCAGCAGAVALMRSAHGMPTIVRTAELLPRPAADHQEALAAARTLWVGISCTGICVALLVSAVATTWYGPEKKSASLEITTPSGKLCGSLLRTSGGKTTLIAGKNEISFASSEVMAVRPVENCRPRKSEGK